MIQKYRVAASLFALLGVPLVTRAADVPFEFTLPKPAVTSAGVYDSDGKLVRVLWTLEKLDAGKFSRAWDGKDQIGHDAPAGEYHYKIVANRAAYTNVGAIGNSGLPPDSKSHTPTHMAQVAVDDAGNVYTVNDWDEAGADFKKWDKDGKSVYDAEYQIRNGQPNGGPYAIAIDDTYLYCAMSGWPDDHWKEAQQIQRFRLKDGKQEKFTKTGREDGHIQVYEWPSKQIPAGTPAAEAERMKKPLRAIAVGRTELFVADALGNRILTYDKVTGELISRRPGDINLNFKSPNALAINPLGPPLWIGYGSHNVLAFEPQRSPRDGDARQIKDIGEVAAIAFDSKGRLYVADQAAGKVKIYFVGRHELTLDVTLGQPAKPGDRAADRFFQLNGVAVDKADNVYTVQDEPVGGARLAKWSPDARSFKLAWEHFGCEFVSLGNYGVHDPDNFYSMTFHSYRLGERSAGKWDYAGDGAPWPQRRYYSDVHGVPRVLKFGDHTFYFLPSGDGVQIYRVDSGKDPGAGKAFHLAALVGGRSPMPDGQREGKQLGQWTWHDADGQGEPKPDQINWFKKPGEGHYSCFGMDADAAGNIVFANTETHSIWLLPVGPLDAAGNPTYDWKDAKEIVKKDTSPLKFEPSMAQRADDGSFYAFGWSSAWPQPKGNPFWMGGTTLARFDKSGNRLWAVGLPALVVGLDSIPGGGCMVGEGKDAKISHYSADGLLIGTMKPGAAMAAQSGWLDNHASVAVNRDPRDSVLDVFAEDDFTLRIGWYRVNDREAETLGGKVSVK
ncbi:MAG TPA: FlgD immunoglobulin-like domain containing protein [Tepidisphaeraceae bacterium]|nr:FlgD immunoglobulin-like domain containing protein [Tepidisphaeraceae bacterium]